MKLIYWIICSLFGHKRWDYGCDIPFISYYGHYNVPKSNYGIINPKYQKPDYGFDVCTRCRNLYAAKL